MPVCAYHALATQEDELRRRFGDDSSVPVFPSARGTVVAKEKVVQTIEVIAERLGVPTSNSYGERAFGGHSMRATGAQFLAARGMPLLSIQLMARWSSHILARYVADAPLETITDQFINAGARIDLEALLASRDKPLVELQKFVSSIDQQTRELFSEERRLKALVERCFPTGAKRGAPYIISGNDKATCRRPSSTLKWPAVTGSPVADGPLASQIIIRPLVPASITRSAAHASGGAPRKQRSWTRAAEALLLTAAGVRQAA